MSIPIENVHCLGHFLLYYDIFPYCHSAFSMSKGIVTTDTADPTHNMHKIMINLYLQEISLVIFFCTCQIYYYLVAETSDNCCCLWVVTLHTCSKPVLHYRDFSIDDPFSSLLPSLTQTCSTAPTARAFSPPHRLLSPIPMPVGYHQHQYPSTEMPPSRPMSPGEQCGRIDIHDKWMDGKAGEPTENDLKVHCNAVVHAVVWYDEVLRI